MSLIAANRLVVACEDVYHNNETFVCVKAQWILKYWPEEDAVCRVKESDIVSPACGRIDIYT